MRVPLANTGIETSGPRPKARPLLFCRRAGKSDPLSSVTLQCQNIANSQGDVPFVLVNLVKSRSRGVPHLCGIQINGRASNNLVSPHVKASIAGSCGGIESI